VLSSQFLVAVVTVLLAASGCSRELPAERVAIATRKPPAVRVAGTTATPASGEAVASLPVRGASGVAVVELFTSEGCSSCPPADRVLAGLTARAKASSLQVYTLSFHVDYWNYLGWRDRFSSASYSERQHGYSGISGNGGTYTPQVVINGETECVGSDAPRIDELIDSALERETRTQIALTAKRGAHGVEVDYRVSGATTGRVLNIALLEPHAESQVEHGENAGERLAHVNVVRAFATRALSDGNSGQWTLPTGPDFQARRLGVVAYAEGSSQRDISGAVALELP
jgi:hypothetical protein